MRFQPHPPEVITESTLVRVPGTEIIPLRMKTIPTHSDTPTSRRPAKCQSLIRTLGILIATVTLTPLPLNAIESEVGKAFAAFELQSISSRTTQAMTRAATQFLGKLDPVVRGDAQLPFNTPEKAVWSNLPPNLDYRGVRIADLSGPELQQLMFLLATSLSPEGFEKVRGIMLGDDLLVRGDQTGNRMLFGADNYWFFIFGTPSSDQAWGWQFDGHHLAINLTIRGDKVTLAPSFIGTQPADVAWGKGYEHQPMSAEVNQAFALINQLSAEQRQKAIVGDRRQNLDAGPGDDDAQPKPTGIKGSALNAAQKTALANLIHQWQQILPQAYAAKRLGKVRETIADTYFGWWGETSPESPVYYRIQGPHVLIEFANQNLGGNPLQHLHSVYREPGNDYGAGF